jgi:hypothetical protein
MANNYRSRRSYQIGQKLVVAIMETLERRNLFSGVSFATPVDFTVGGVPYAIVASSSIYTANGNGTVSILASNFDGTFEPAQTIADGLPDGIGSSQDLLVDSAGILVTNQAADGEVSFLPANPKLVGYESPTQIMANNGSGIVGMLMITRTNGTADLVIANDDGSVSILQSNSDGTFKSPTVLSVGGNITSITTNDIDEPGDIVLADGGHALLLAANGDGTYKAPQVIALAGTDVQSVDAYSRFGLIVNNEDGSVNLLQSESGGAFIGTPIAGASSSLPDVVTGNFTGVNPNSLAVLPAGAMASVLARTPADTFLMTATDLNAPSDLSTVTPITDSDGETDLVFDENDSQTVALLSNSTLASPTIISLGHSSFTTGTSGSASIFTDGNPKPAFTETGALPTGVRFSAGLFGLQLSGTPAPGTGGVYDIAIKAKNGVLPTAKEIFTLTVDAAPAITSPAAVTFTAGISGKFRISTSGFPIAALSVVGSLPSGLLFHDDGNGTAKITGTPAVGTGGLYTVMIKAINGTKPTARQELTLTIDQAAAFTSPAHATIAAGSNGSFIIAASGFPTPAFAELGALPTGITFHDNGNGAAILSGLPPDGAIGIYSLSLLAFNGVVPAATDVLKLTVD